MAADLTADLLFSTGAEDEKQENKALDIGMEAPSTSAAAPSTHLGDAGLLAAESKQQEGTVPGDLLGDAPLSAGLASGQHSEAQAAAEDEEDLLGGPSLSTVPVLASSLGDDDDLLL
eukprot:TRINITY_DN5049_c0_g1_i7.p3 TRINITY_DN5049_c0_g1~~TRINITY_DN5049_c0_g1_i7.p3  ORF type:complete len:117 (-),score=36.63 TRINITY_DN5049_c0_g1_i7:49-399(-)